MLIMGLEEGGWQVCMTSLRQRCYEEGAGWGLCPTDARALGSGWWMRRLAELGDRTLIEQ